jgi:hypothetical protein
MPATSSAPVLSQVRQAPPRHDHAHLGRHLVETFQRVLADDVQVAAAARAGLAQRLDHHLLVRQMIELLVAASPALPRGSGLQCFQALTKGVKNDSVIIVSSFRCSETGSPRRPECSRSLH